jgi:predicted NBD/HSP70 family sugar kinase
MPIPTNSHSRLKLQNTSAILSAFLRDDTLSRSQLADQTGLSSATVTNLVAELVGMGVLVEGEQVRSGVGRPQTMLRIVPTSRYAVGVHLDVEQVHLVLTDLLANTITSTTVPSHSDWQTLLTSVAHHTLQLLSESHISTDNVLGLGVAATGLVLPDSGINVIAPNMGWRDVPLRDTLAALLPFPVVVDNNVRAMALYETLFGQGRNTDALAFVYARVGVGAGLVVDRRLYRGSGAGAGEIGHNTVVFTDAQRCRCGNDGCLETVFSEPALTALGEAHRHANPDGILAGLLPSHTTPTLPYLLAAVTQGDDVLAAQLQEQARYIGFELANLVNMFNPDMIVLGGLFTQDTGLFHDVIQAIVQHRTFGNLGRQVTITTTQLGTLVGAVGAAAIVLDAQFFRPPLWSR